MQELPSTNLQTLGFFCLKVLPDAKSPQRTLLFRNYCASRQCPECECRAAEVCFVADCIRSEFLAPMYAIGAIAEVHA